MVEIGLTVSALITLAFFSIAFKMNPAFRVAESLFLGALAGQIFVTAWNSIRAVDITPLTSGTNFLPALVSIIVGVLVFTRPTKDYSWLARYPSSLMVFGRTTAMIERLIFLVLEWLPSLTR
jgi:uncharacterized membrane protein